MLTVPVCFSLKKQKESEGVEIKRSALDDSSNDMSDDEHKKDCIDKTESSHIKSNKSSNSSVKRNSLQNTARLGELRKNFSCSTFFFVYNIYIF